MSFQGVKRFFIDKQYVKKSQNSAHTVQLIIIFYGYP